MLSTLEHSLLRTSRSARLGIAAARFGTSASGTPEPEADSQPKSSSSPSSSSKSGVPPLRSPEANAAAVEDLWERVLRTPASVITSESSSSKPGLKSLLERSTPASRSFKGTTSRLHRALGQTPAEAGKVRDSLQAMFRDLNARMLQPVQGGALSSLVRPSGLSRKRIEEEDPALREEVDAKTEALTMITSAAEVVSWAEENVFTREALDSQSRAGYLRTYPRLLAAVMRHLRTLAAPHLSLAMFEHARALGVESYLAGCQTSAFNELLRTRWDAFRDLEGVVSAIREMEAHAVAWDRTTNGIVTNVTNVVGSDLLHHRNHWGSDAYTLLAVLEKAIAEDTRREAEIFERKAEGKRLFRHRTRIAASNSPWDDSSEGGRRRDSYGGDRERRGGSYDSERRSRPRGRPPRDNARHDWD